jgi:hypothetical protein
MVGMLTATVFLITPINEFTPSTGRTYPTILDVLIAILVDWHSS